MVYGIVMKPARPLPLSVCSRSLMDIGIQQRATLPRDRLMMTDGEQRRRFAGGDGVMPSCDTA
jgi:hypothetical protein